MTTVWELRVAHELSASAGASAGATGASGAGVGVAIMAKSRVKRRLVVKLDWPAPVEFTVLLVATMLVPITIYQLFVRHWMPVRMLFGLRPKHREPPPQQLTAADAPHAGAPAP